MGWFDEQIRQRRNSDQEVFEDSIFNMASSIIGKKGAKVIADKRFVSQKAIEEIIKYMGFKPQNDMADLKDVVKSYGIMYRRVELKGNWHKDAYGPMLGYVGEEKKPIALIPDSSGKYSYYDYFEKKKIWINKYNVKKINEDAYCFYKPLPRKSLKIRDLLRFVMECIDSGDIIKYIVLISIVTAISMMFPSFNNFIAGYVLKSRSIQLLFGTSMFLFTTVIASQLIEACTELVEERFSAKVSINVESAVMGRILNLPSSFFKKYSSGELSSRIGAVNSLCELLVTHIFTVPMVVAFSMVYFVQIRNYTPSLVIPSVIIMILSFCVSVATIIIQSGITSSIMQYDAHEDGISYSLINGIQKIKLSGAEKRAFAKWANDYTESAMLSYNPPLFIKINATIHLAINIIGSIVLYYIAVISEIEPSEYIAFTSAFGFIEGAFSELTDVVNSAAQIRPILNLAEPILKATPENTGNKQLVSRLNGAIELNNVSFRYKENGPLVLKGLNLKIKQGEYLAIVGKTGCGKSTIIRLLLGFETPEKGAIYYDSKDINRLDLRSLRRKIGSVTQYGTLFQGDIYSNIVISDPTLSVDDAWEAAEIAGIAEDIKQMPMGMFTYISEGQGGISGGQKQRLMIARAVAPKPRVLFLDEATSALDNITQKRVSEALDNLKCTRIVIAHRLSTIKNCDRIVVLDGGKIVEDGTYDELVAKNGYFKELVARQQI